MEGRVGAFESLLVAQEPGSHSGNVRLWEASGIFFPTISLVGARVYLCELHSLRTNG